MGVVRLLVRDLAGAGAWRKVAATPGGNSALDAALREAKDVCPRAGRGFAEPDESTLEERGSMTETEK